MRWSSVPSYGLLIRPVLAVIGMHSHPLQRVLVSDASVTQKEYKAGQKPLIVDANTNPLIAMQPKTSSALSWPLPRNFPPPYAHS